jgi:DNA-binding PadR family transcriptional regulator
MGKGDWLGEFELCVMLTVAHLGTDAYGVNVRRHIKERTGRVASIGAIYTTLSRLHDKGLIRFDMSDPQPVAGGRARKIFRLTSAGHRQVSQTTALLGRLIVAWKSSGQR